MPLRMSTTAPPNLLVAWRSRCLSMSTGALPQITHLDVEFALLRMVALLFVLLDLTPPRLTDIYQKTNDCHWFTGGRLMTLAYVNADTSHFLEAQSPSRLGHAFAKSPYAEA